MFKLSVLAFASVMSVSVGATERETFKPNQQTQSQQQYSQQGNQQGVYAGDNNLYVLPAPVSAANLPPGLCPQGDSLSWSIGWNFFSYSRSSTRSEMECLDKVLAVMRANPAPAPVSLPVVANPNPVCVYIEQPTAGKQLAHKPTAPVKTQLQCK